jgi:hypothetical protein
MRNQLRLVDGLMVKSSTGPGGPFRRFLRAQAQTARTQLRNWVSHGHHQFAQHLVDNSNYAFFLKLGVGRMVERWNSERDTVRVLGPMATRQLLAWRHGEFRTQVLASKLRFFPGCCVLNVSENYTTKG